MKRINDVLEKILIYIGITLFAIFILVVFLQVLSRNFLRVSMFWTQEVALLSFIWSVFFGGAVALRQRKHYVTEIFPSRMVRLNMILDLFADLAVFILIYVFIISGWNFTMMGFTRLSRVLLIPQAYFFFPFPISGLFMFLFGIENLMEDLQRAIKIFGGGENHEPTGPTNG